MKFCQHCGKELQDGAAFCPGCGKPVDPAAGTVAGQENNVQNAAQGGRFSLGTIVLYIIIFIVIYTIIKIVGIYL